MRIAARLGAGLVILLFLLVGAGLGLRAWLQHVHAEAMAIRTPNGIDEARFVRLRGIEQWVTIRGEDGANPVLLFLAGGPGDSVGPVAYQAFRPWERRFTMVEWDQPGSGRTYSANGRDAEPPLTIESVRDDGIALTTFLRAHLRKRRIVLVGHSWGSAVGLEMVKLRPDLFSAYVGTGQVVDNVRNEDVGFATLMARAAAAQDHASLAKLRATGGPPWHNIDALVAERAVGSAYAPEADRRVISRIPFLVLTAPGYSLVDAYDAQRSDWVTAERCFAMLMHYSVAHLGTRFDVPIFFFEGAEDEQVSETLAKRYFDTISAPQKAFVTFPKVGHFAVLADSDAFLRELDERVRPLALAAQQ